MACMADDADDVTPVPLCVHLHGISRTTIVCGPSTWTPSLLRQRYQIWQHPVLALQRQGSVPLSSATIGVNRALILQNETVPELVKACLSLQPRGPRHLRSRDLWRSLHLRVAYANRTCSTFHYSADCTSEQNRGIECTLVAHQKMWRSYLRYLFQVALGMFLCTGLLSAS